MDKSANNIVGTIGVSNQIENLITESSKFIVFVSPYLNITNRLKGMLIDALNRLDHCYFIHRENELKKEEENWLKSFKNITLIKVENLHAKIYLNEGLCLLTSMNFYEYSQINNYEIGVVLKDKKDYQQILNEILLMTRLSPEYNKLSDLLDPYFGYTVGDLFCKIQDHSKKYNKRFFEDNPYVRFSEDVRSVVSFAEKDLYQDKTAILRSTVISKSKYDYIFNKLRS